jgi:glutamate synthase (NADPH/NADH) large chain/glutamate synthase (ferredoxin)
MTRGTVVVLGECGLNFGAGMSGGLAFVYDDKETFAERYNSQLIMTERLADAEEIESLRKLVALHAEQTGSSHAKALADNWPAEVLKFWKVVPFPPTADTPKPCYRFENFAQSLVTPVSPVCPP